MKTGALLPLHRLVLHQSLCRFNCFDCWGEGGVSTSCFNSSLRAEAGLSVHQGALLIT